MTCWICGGKDCANWGCSSTGMPALTPNALMALRLPRLCIVCEERPALIGNGSNLCEVCDPPSLKSSFQDGDEDESHTLESSIAYLGGHVGRHGDVL